MSATVKVLEQWVKMVIDINGIDTEQDVEDQIRGADSALDKVYATLKNRLAVQVGEAQDSAVANLREVD